MQGKSHVGFAITGSITINSGLYALLPHMLPGVAENVLHAIGQPFTYVQIVSLWQTHHLFDFNSFVILGHKFSFYLLLIICARLPDRLERRKPDSVTGIPVKHRGFTHSCLILFFLIFFSIALCVLAGNYFQRQHLVIDPFFIKEVAALFLGVLFAWILHIIADSLTTQGVKIFWPDEKYHGLLPRSMRFSNGTWPEYIVLWGYIFLTGGLIFLGKLGV
jgi:membrane-bound metal-dependent hydrolase YbcI (DUF457 family)